jgi:hypothetical protein
MTDVKAQKATFKGYALVRNKDGQPQFNDWHDIPEIFHSSLTVSDWEYIYKRRKKCL